MPNVMVMSQYGSNEDSRIKYETACKNAWCAMGEEFSASDVGGVQVVVAREALKIRWTTTVFAYSDRGPEFDLKLKRSLEKELAKVFGLSLVVITCPTPPHAWFADPIWATAPAKD